MEWHNAFEIPHPHPNEIVLGAWSSARGWNFCVVRYLPGVVKDYWVEQVEDFDHMPIERWFNPKGILSFETLDDLENLLTDLPSVSQDVIDENVDLARRYRVPEDWLWRHYPDLFEGVQ